MHKIQREILNLAQHQNISTLSLSEIAAKVGAKSPQIVKYHERQLEKLGFNLFNQATANANPDQFELISIPIVGSANCGPADIFADERVEGHLRISSRLLQTSRHNDLYALRAQGTSMNRASVHGNPINDGDFVIIDSTSTQPEPGDYVVAVVGGLANIKRYYSDPLNDQVAFISESTDDFSPIFLHEADQYDAVVAGKVIQVVSKPAA
jgi:repressor LexA